MRVLDLFSGIGGFSLGLSWAGDFRTIRFCEKDEFCRKVLRKHWPDVPIVEDIHDLSSYAGEADIVVGGFPCQPFSQAGRKLAARDPRHLWPQMLRVIKECRPAWVIGENVIGLTRLGLDAVLSDLAGAGYSTRVFDIPAVAVGAPHRRSRLWIIAHANGTRSQGCGTPRGTREGRWATQGARGQSASGCDWWDSEPGMGRVAHGVPGRMERLRALGNAVVPQIVAEIGRAILKE